VRCQSRIRPAYRPAKENPRFAGIFYVRLRSRPPGNTVHVMRIVGAALLAALAFSALPAAATTSSATGIRGVVRLSHGCPGPAREGEMRRCDFPGVDILVRVYAANRVVASTRTDRRGRFALPLRPGSYSVAAVVANALSARPAAVRVRAAHWSVVTLRYLLAPLME
jgi:hypothetical protein